MNGMGRMTNKIPSNQKVLTPGNVWWDTRFLTVVVASNGNKKLHLTPDGVDMVKTMRTARQPWEVIGEALGVSRYCVVAAAIHAKIYAVLPPPPEKPISPRQAAGPEPLPYGHPIAMAELEHARMMRFDTGTRR